MLFKLTVSTCLLAAYSTVLAMPPQQQLSASSNNNTEDDVMTPSEDLSSMYYPKNTQECYDENLRKRMRLELYADDNPRQLYPERVLCINIFNRKIKYRPRKLPKFVPANKEECQDQELLDRMDFRDQGWNTWAIPLDQKGKCLYYIEENIVEPPPEPKSDLFMLFFIAMVSAVIWVCLTALCCCLKKCKLANGRPNPYLDDNNGRNSFHHDHRQRTEPYVSPAQGPSAAYHYEDLGWYPSGASGNNSAAARQSQLSTENPIPSYEEACSRPLKEPSSSSLAAPPPAYFDAVVKK